MGLYSSSTKSETKLPEPTDAEKRMAAYESAAIDAILKEGGYEVTISEETVYENPARVETLQSSITNLSDQKAQIESQIAGLGPNWSNAKSQLQAQLNSINSQITKANQDLSAEQAKVTTKYTSTMTEREDERVAALREAGDTAGADALKSKLQADKMATQDKEDRVYAQFLDATEKFMSQDFSITAEQKAQIDEIASQYRDPIMAAVDQLKAEIGVTEGKTLESLLNEEQQVGITKSNILTAFSALTDRIKQTGLEVEDALTEAEVRAKQNGIDMNAALDESIAASKALMENNLFDATKELRIANARLSSSLGRASTDSAMVERLNQQVLDATKSAGLNLASMAANGKFQVSQKTADALMGIADYRVGLRQSQGTKLESVEASKAALEESSGNQLLGIRQRTTDTLAGAGLRREDVAKLRAGVEENSQKFASGLRLNAAQPFQQIAAGQSAAGTIANMNALPFNTLMAANQPIQQELSAERGLRAAQPTTTTTQSGSIMSGIFSALGVGASAFSAGATGISDLRTAGAFA